MVSKTFVFNRYWFRQALLTVLVGTISAFLNSLYAGEPFLAHVDPDGRVVFTNEASPSYVSDRASAQFSGADSSSNASSARTRIHELIDWIAGEHRVDPELIRAVVQVESNFDPRAVSPKGAMGLMQLIPATARRFGVRNAFDPKANLDGGIRYLKYLMELFDGDLQLALAAYNAGENVVSRMRGVPSFPETRNYVRKVAQLYPLDHPRQAASAVSEIEKFVDSKGVVHFSNTELP